MSRPLAEVDLECFHDYFLAKFFVGEGMYPYAIWPGSEPLNIAAIEYILRNVTIITFNGNHYDLNLLLYALMGADTAQLKELNDAIIVGGLKYWEVRDRYNIVVPDYVDHIDIMEPTPGVRIGLKMYMARMHAPTIQDLPFDPNERPDAIKRFVLNDYCGNDLIGTRMLRQEVWDRIALRQALTETYNVDVRSKSDAQIAEAVIMASLDFRPQQRYIPHGYTFYYDPPAYIDFITPDMKALLHTVRVAPFVVTDKEEALEIFGESIGVRTGVNIPAELKGRDIVIGQAKYRIGIGGLHSQEQSASHYTIPGVQTLKDVDVKSYYPSLILSMGMYPEQVGPGFLEIYRRIYKRRLQAKAQGATTEADGLKIVLNGTFGKLFSKYSRPLYAPELGIRTTITGQLALLMLIEMMEYSGIRVVSANTDGIVLLIPHGREGIAQDVVKWWEQRTGLEMEDTTYKSIHSRDVNNYFAIGTNGKVKRKGAYVPGGILTAHAGKGPNMDICADAVEAFLKDGTEIHKTVQACTDIRKFVVVRGVSGGGYYNGQFLGKVVRWYYGKTPGFIATSAGHQVAGSKGATPIMRLPDALPADVDYDKYTNEAYEILADIGLPVQYWWHEHHQALMVRCAEEFGPLHPTIFGWTEIDRKTYDKRKAQQ